MNRNWREYLMEGGELALFMICACVFGVLLERGGIAVFPAHGTVPDQILNQADAMLYRSKQSGRNRISVASAA